MFQAFSPRVNEPSGFAMKPGTQPITNWTGQGTVLVVDDEEMVRDVARMMLEMYGFSVLIARNGIEGLQSVVAHQGIDAVLLDLTMPKMNGEETLREMQRLRPELPIFLVSGFNEGEVTEHFQDKKIAGFIQKPFHMTEIINKLRPVIDLASRSEA